MSDAFIQHLIDRTLGSTATTPITVRHALRPDMLWRPYSQQMSDDISTLDEHADKRNSDSSSININDKKTDNRSKDEPDAEVIIPRHDRINKNKRYEDTYQTEKNGIQTDSRHEKTKPEPARVGNTTTGKENRFFTPFSSMPKSRGRQEKQGESQTNGNNRPERFLSHPDSSEIDRGQARKIPSVGGHDSQRTDKDREDSEQNLSPLDLDDNNSKLIGGGARTSQRRPSVGDAKSSSADTFDKRNIKSLPIKERQSDDSRNTEAGRRRSSSEMDIKGGTRPSPALQRSNLLAKQEKTWPTLAANNDDTTSVTISIGRIEVRAVSPQMQQQQQTSLGPKKGFGLSLQEYIKLRDEGQL